ncbi:MAG: hypothetical protein U0793_25370 [Gemmataceae bacterium]
MADLTTTNFMAGNLTSQARHRRRMHRGGQRRLEQTGFTVEAKGETAALADTINNMIDTLATFADQVTEAWPAKSARVEEDGRPGFRQARAGTGKT